MLASEERRTADVLLLDMWMPGRQGLGAIRELSADQPVILVSDTPPSSPIAREAQAQGAVAVFAKAELADEAGAERLRAAVRAAVGRGEARPPPVVAIVGSTGAIRAMQELATGLRGAVASVLIVQHMPHGREASFAEWLTGFGLPTRPVWRSDVLEVRRALLATGAGHMVLKDRGRVAVESGVPVGGHMPSGTVLLQSAASLGGRLVAVILSGMGNDGAAAVGAVLDAGGRCVVQAPEDCVAPSMPLSALEVSPKVRPVRLIDSGDAVRRVVVRGVGRRVR